MSSWHPQHYRREALNRGADPIVVGHATKTGAYTVAKNKDRPPVLSLRHFGHLADVPYEFLRAVVS